MKKPEWIFGFSLLFVLGFLSARVALGRVEEQTSYGLPILLNTLGILAGAFAQWAFGSKKDS